ncbi:MAG: DUF1461 domain-containing protein [Nanoarchaeota archaeon]|nr:DUF1461 domain-containing protein [Nanoarchaeota archaeon]
MKLVYLVPIFILLLSLNFVVFDNDFFLSKDSGFEFYEEEVSNLLDYFSGNDLDEERYSEEEIIHLKDVKLLIWSSLVILIGLLVSFVIFVKKLNHKKFFLKSGVVSLVFFGLVSLIFLNFSWAFRKFHEILFWNDYWMLPVDSTLIQMFPQSFFVSAGIRIILYSFILSLILIVLGYIPRERKNERT